MFRICKHCFDPRKGTGLTSPNQDVDIARQRERIRPRRREPWEALSFLFNRRLPGIKLSGDRVYLAGKAPCLPRCLVRSRLPWKSRRTDLFTPVVVPITALGLQFVASGKFPMMLKRGRRKRRRGAADAHDAGPGGAHHEHRWTSWGRPKRCAKRLRQNVCEAPVGRSSGAADAHDASPAA